MLEVLEALLSSTLDCGARAGLRRAGRDALRARRRGERRRRGDDARRRLRARRWRRWSCPRRWGCSWAWARARCWPRSTRCLQPALARGPGGLAAWRSTWWRWPAAPSCSRSLYSPTGTPSIAQLPRWTLPRSSSAAAARALRALAAHLPGARAALRLRTSLLQRTPLGLRLRAVGEKPHAAATLGVRVCGLRYGAVLGGGLLAGLGGAALSTSTLDRFEHHMPAGLGFMAVAAMVFGRWTPLGAFGAALFFAFGNALRIGLASSAPGCSRWCPRASCSPCPTCSRWWCSRRAGARRRARGAGHPVRAGVALAAHARALGWPERADGRAYR